MTKLGKAVQIICSNRKLTVFFFFNGSSHISFFPPAGFWLYILQDISKKPEARNLNLCGKTPEHTWAYRALCDDHIDIMQTHPSLILSDTSQRTLVSLSSTCIQQLQQFTFLSAWKNHHWLFYSCGMSVNKQCGLSCTRRLTLDEVQHSARKLQLCFSLVANGGELRGGSILYSTQS